ncbi:MAG: single-stranded-DNA-specific exonuclease RecJ [Muribaculaceae bacterium]|nr:single-stranded-DNA-specific exonuclease RecJ [Roseburia sp.]MCM1431726.1 single-stranded-DNA-specific exonuclease RecJ [Muribaculaceae bacterium]MCM1493407.1 single-stranded-DNA-specific exonuclease RecJ [Muribaculaceae bacterium]
MTQWMVATKRADFNAIGERFGIDPVTARLLRNRGLRSEEEIRSFLTGGAQNLQDAHLLKDGDRLADILCKKLRDGAAIRIIGDYDIDGVMSGYILYCGLTRCGGKVDVSIPHRIADGYGLNMHLIEAALQAGVDTILTCDNGIAALDEIAYAKSRGMTVLVTDHHELPFVEENGEKHYLKSRADAVVNPHQPDCAYPYKELCGAAVAWKILVLLYEKMGIPASGAEELLEYVAFATVGDIMPLTGENRILVKEGLKRIHRTANIGMRALIAECGLVPAQIDAYHFGFVLGPCINAAGRLETAQKALLLFQTKDAGEAKRLAEELVELNVRRKELTNQGVGQARELVESGACGDGPVLVVFLPGVHESIAGIIAGRLKEYYYRPVFVLTRAETGVKGSGRSIEEYSMYEELCRCRELFTRFGGHPMAAGISMPEANVEEFRRRINAQCTLTPQQLEEKIHIDVPMPVDYANLELVREFALLAPFGRENPRPLFADKNLSVSRLWVCGKNQNVLRLTLVSGHGTCVSCIYFGDIPAFFAYLREHFGEKELVAALGGRENAIRLSIVYSPRINEYQGNETLQLEIKYYR